MKRVLVKIAYLGDDFNGSQIQPSGRTVESVVLEKLTVVMKLSPEELDLKFSSRTDKGVNALGNAIVFNSIFDDDGLMLKALNSIGRDIYFRSVCDVDQDFNVRYATGRVYRYVLPSEGMDLALARECADMFLGEHDFARFCKPDNKPTTANVESIDMREEDGLLIIEFQARFFLWNMIRRMVAAIDAVSKCVRTLDDVDRALNGLEEINFGVARPDALTLVDVVYDWLDFTEAGQDQFESRKREEEFSQGLRRTFFGSL